MNELEDLLRQQLHTAADPIEVPVDDQAVLAEGRRARTARTLRWVVLGLALLAAASASLFALWQGTLAEDRRALPNPLQTPTVQPVVPSPSATTTPSATPASPPSAPSPTGSVEAALIDFKFRDRPSQVRVEAIDGGLRFTGVDVGDGRPVDIAAGGVRGGDPEQGWVLATLPPGTTWAMFVPTDDATRMMGGVQQVVAVPGTDLVAYALVIPEADAVTPGTIRILYGNRGGDVFKSDSGQAIPAETFETLNGRRATWFTDDAWRVTGVVDHEIDYTSYELLRPGHVPGMALGGPDAESMEFVVVLPAGSDPASLRWSFQAGTETVSGPTVRTRPDGRVMVHQGFRGPGISTGASPEFTVSYTVNGTPTSSPVALGP